MNQNRRDVMKSSIALTVLTVSKASAQTAAPRKIGLVTSTRLKRNDDPMDCFLKGLRVRRVDRDRLRQ
jgi:hypothetical protein